MFLNFVGYKTTGKSTSFCSPDTHSSNKVTFCLHGPSRKEGILCRYWCQRVCKQMYRWLYRDHQPLSAPNLLIWQQLWWFYWLRVCYWPSGDCSNLLFKFHLRINANIISLLFSSLAAFTRQCSCFCFNRVLTGFWHQNQPGASLRFNFWKCSPSIFLS